MSSVSLASNNTVSSDITDCVSVKAVSMVIVLATWCGRVEKRVFHKVNNGSASDTEMKVQVRELSERVE